METRICKVCGKEKKLNQYYKQGTGKGGYTGKCKLCYIEYRKKLELNTPFNYSIKPKNLFSSNREIKIYCATKKDYCDMYNLLEEIGYNPNEDIAMQFAQKYNLPYKKRTKSIDENKWTYSDCINETPND